MKIQKITPNTAMTLAPSWSANTAVTFVKTRMAITITTITRRLFRACIAQIAEGIEPASSSQKRQSPND